jgi:serine/threonine protein kinase
MDEQSIFLQALEQPAGEARDKWLDGACAGDAELRARIDALLARDAQAGSFLESPPSEFEGTIIGEVHGDLAASMEAGLAPTFETGEAVILGDAGHSVLKSLGKTIDVPHVVLRESTAEGPDPIMRPQSPEMSQGASDSRYQLQGEIARGGMGAIIKGRDTDLGRDLAIKVLLDSHKDKPEVIQRFVEEAQIGGQLQHPGIAPIYELGQFKDKRPFFAMKLVKGETLSKLLAERENPAEDRGRFVGIFEQVCQTVAYAHSRGVIHRDLKPANIMVGAFGEVQVMDWGLAKVLATGGVADEKSSQARQEDFSVIQTMRSVGSDTPARFGSSGSETQMGSVMGTPAYMPPEQALGEIDQLDERSDVFGLGAILCEILSGKPPYVGDDATQVYRLASRGKLDDCMTRLDNCHADSELIAVAKHCLELEPGNRPRDAGKLAERVTEYLESVETKLRETEIRRAAQAARADEEAKRRRVSLALAASVCLFIVLGSGSWLYVLHQKAEQQTAEAAVQRKHAEELQKLADERDVQRKESEAVSTLLVEVFESPSPYINGRNITVAETLDHAVKNLDKNLADQPKLLKKMQWTLGLTYTAIGLAAEAVPLQESALDYYLETYGPEHRQTLELKKNLAYSYSEAGFRGKALKLREEILETSLRMFGPEDLDTLSIQVFLADSYFFAGRWDEALELRKKAFEIRLKLLGRTHGLTVYLMEDLANSYDQRGDLNKALVMREEALELRRKYDDPESPYLIRTMQSLAISYHKAGRGEDGLKLEEDALKLSRKAFGEDHITTTLMMRSLAVTYDEQNRQEESLELREEALRLHRQAGRLNHPRTLEAITFLANYYQTYAGRHAEALKMREEVLPQYLEHESFGPEHPDTLGAMTNLAISYLQADRFEEGIEVQAKALSIIRRVSDPTDEHIPRAMRNLAMLLEKAGRRKEAIELWDESQVLSGGTTFSEQFRPLDKVLAGEPISDPDELVSIAKIACKVRRFRDAAELYGKAFKLKPSLMDRESYGFHSATCAALVANGQGLDDPPPTEDAKKMFRKTALEWLDKELDAIADSLDSVNSPDANEIIACNLNFFKNSPYLAGIRDELPLAKLSDTDRATCEALWTRVDKLLAKVAPQNNQQQ